MLILLCAVRYIGVYGEDIIRLFKIINKKNGQIVTQFGGSGGNCDPPSMHAGYFGILLVNTVVKILDTFCINSF